MFCPNCGKPIDDGDLFCSFCGRRITVNDTQMNSPFDAVVPPDTQPTRNDPVQLPNSGEINAYPTYSASIPSRGALPNAGEINAYPTQPVQYVQPKKGSGVLVGALTAVSILLAAACFMLFVKPGYIRHKDVPVSSDTVSSSSSEKNTDKKHHEFTSTQLEDTDSEEQVYSESVSSNESSSQKGSSKSASSKAPSSKVTSSKAASSKATSSKAASSKAASSKVASSKTASSKVTSSKAASSKTASSKAASSKTASSKAASSQAVSSKVTSSKQETVSQYVPEPQPQIESQPEHEPQPEPTPSDSENDYSGEYNENSLAYAEAMTYSTDERPTFDEFEWCFGQYGLVYEPTSGEMIMNDLGFSGGWKCMIIYNPTNNAGTFIRELNNVSIGVYNGIVDLTVDWYLMSNDSQSGVDNEESMPDTLYLGSSLNGGVSVSSDETKTSMVIRYFWKENGHEYALGTMQLADGLSAYVALTR